MTRRYYLGLEFNSVGESLSKIHKALAEFRNKYTDENIKNKREFFRHK